MGGEMPELMKFLSLFSCLRSGHQFLQRTLPKKQFLATAADDGHLQFWSLFLDRQGGDENCPACSEVESALNGKESWEPAQQKSRKQVATGI